MHSFGDEEGALPEGTPGQRQECQDARMGKWAKGKSSGKINDKWQWKTELPRSWSVPTTRMRRPRRLHNNSARKNPK